MKRTKKGGEPLRPKEKKNKIKEKKEIEKKEHNKKKKEKGEIGKKERKKKKRGKLFYFDFQILFPLVS